MCKLKKGDSSLLPHHCPVDWSEVRNETRFSNLELKSTDCDLGFVCFGFF